MASSSLMQTAMPLSPSQFLGDTLKLSPASASASAAAANSSSSHGSASSSRLSIRASAYTDELIKTAVRSPPIKLLSVPDLSLSLLCRVYKRGTCISRL
jgi:hypothetical protein